MYQKAGGMKRERAAGSLSKMALYGEMVHFAIQRTAYVQREEIELGV